MTKDKDWNPPKFETVEEISKQIQDQDTPSRKQARDKNLLRKSFEEAKKMHGRRLYPYKLDFVENNLARNSLSINKEMLPRVENVILKVCNN